MERFLCLSHKIKNKNYHTVRTIPKSKRKFRERKTDTTNTHIHHRSLSMISDLHRNIWFLQFVAKNILGYDLLWQKPNPPPSKIRPQFIPNISSKGLSGALVTLFLVWCVCFKDRCLSFCLLVIVLSVLLRFTDSYYLPLLSLSTSSDYSVR